MTWVDDAASDLAEPLKSDGDGDLELDNIRGLLG